MLKGTTDITRLPRIGKIRLGEKAMSGGGKEYPKALPHFNFVDVPHLIEPFGKTCTVIKPILIPVDDENVFLPTARKAYRTAGLFCVCSDGDTASRVRVGPDEKGKERDPQGEAFLAKTGEAVEIGTMFEMPCPGDDCHFAERGFCKKIGRFLFMIPDAPKLGVYEITTTSSNSIRNILSTTRWVRMLTGGVPRSDGTVDGGRVTGIPFSLHLKPMQVQPNGQAKTVYVLELEYEGSSKELLTRNRRLLEGGVQTYELERGEDSTPDDVIPHGGAALDAVLTGQVIPPAASVAPPGPRMPQRAGKSAPPASTPAPGTITVTQLVDELTPKAADDGFKLRAPDADEDPSWSGYLVRGEQKGRMLLLHGHDGKVFGTVNANMYTKGLEYAGNGRQVRIVAGEESRGILRIIEMIPADVPEGAARG